MPEQNALEMFAGFAPGENDLDDFDYDSEHVELISEIKEYSYGEDDEELMEEEITSVSSEPSAAPETPATADTGGAPVEPMPAPAPAPPVKKPVKKAVRKAVKKAPAKTAKKAPAKKAPAKAAKKVPAKKVAKKAPAKKVPMKKAAKKAPAKKAPAKKAAKGKKR